MPALPGDFNARTAQAPDGAAAFNHTSLSPHIPELPPDTELLHSPAPLPPRHNSDPRERPSPQGKEFLELLREHLLAIINGRTTSDSSGECTLTNKNGKGTSLVDYFACSLSLFTAITDMKVLPISPLSDHRPLLLTLRRSSQPSTPTTPPPAIPKFRYAPTQETITQYRSAIPPTDRQVAGQDLRGDHPGIVDRVLGAAERGSVAHFGVVEIVAGCARLDGYGHGTDRLVRRPPVRAERSTALPVGSSRLASAWSRRSCSWNPTPVRTLGVSTRRQALALGTSGATPRG